MSLQDAYFLAYRNAKRITEEMQSDLNFYKKKKDEQADNNKLTAPEIEQALKYSEKATAKIEGLNKFIKQANSFISLMRSENESLQDANAELMHQLQTVHRKRNSKSKAVKQVKRNRVLKQLEEAENRTLYLILNPQAQIDLYGHIRIHPDDYEPYLTNHYQKKYITWESLIKKFPNINPII